MKNIIDVTEVTVGMLSMLNEELGVEVVIEDGKITETIFAEVE